jgi:uncharacterized OB-fold protein
MYCERCLAELHEWVQVPLEGTLTSVTVVHRDVDGAPLPAPAILGLIELDGVSGSQLVHWIGGVNVAQAQPGLRVRAELKPVGDRRGSITDIKFFRPAT